MNEKYLNSSGLKHFWETIKRILDKKLESIKAADKSINASKDSVSVRISNEKSNALQLKDGLYTPKNHTLTFGAHGEFVYDGSEDVTVPAYDGDYDINT